MDNSRILVIPDLHMPYMHMDSLDFLNKLKHTLNPTRVICLGDELDYHAMQFVLGMNNAISREMMEMLAENSAALVMKCLKK